MRKPIMLEFPTEEYSNRIAIFIKKMELFDLDAVILTTKENTRYFSGFRMITWDSKISKPGSLIITRDGDVVLVGSYSGLGTMTVTTWVEDIRPWDRLGRDGMITSYPEAIFDVLEKKGLHEGRVGLEIGIGFRMHLTNTDYVRLMELLSKHVIVDAGPAIWKCRSVKSPLEVERIRKACDINIKSFEKGFKSIYEGMTELELYRVIAMEMMNLGADEIFPLGIRAGADRYSQGNCPPGDRPIGKGEIILVDGGPGYKGYYSDIIREAIIGQPTRRQKELYDFSVAACLEGLKVIKPGIAAKEVCKVIDEFVDKNGYGRLYDSRGWAGHSIGLDIHEPPMFEIGSNLILEPGMVFAIEPSIYEPEVGMFNIEENILITNNGYELLTPLDRNLLVL